MTNLEAVVFLVSLAVTLAAAFSAGRWWGRREGPRADTLTDGIGNDGIGNPLDAVRSVVITPESRSPAVSLVLEGANYAIPDDQTQPTQVFVHVAARNMGGPTPLHGWEFSVTVSGIRFVGRHVPMTSDHVVAGLAPIMAGSAIDARTGNTPLATGGELRGPIKFSVTGARKGDLMHPTTILEIAVLDATGARAMARRTIAELTAGGHYDDRAPAKPTHAPIPIRGGATPH